MDRKKPAFVPEGTVEPLIVCDVYGGLFHQGGERIVNTGLMDFLSLGKGEGYQVALVAADPIKAQLHVSDVCATWFNDASFFGMVQHNEKLHGRNAWVVIEGTQNLGAINAVSYWHADYDARQVEKMRCFWDESLLPRLS